MRAISGRPALVRRYSTSLTVRSNFAPGSYRVVIFNPAAKPSKDMLFRKSRRPKEFMLTSCCANSPPWIRRGGRDHNKNAAKHPLKGADGVIGSTSDNRWLNEPPRLRTAKVASQYFF